MTQLRATPHRPGHTIAACAVGFILFALPLTANTDRVTVAVDWRHEAELIRQCLNDGLAAVVDGGVVVCRKVR